MLLQAPKLELQVIKTICSTNDQKTAAKLFSKLKDDCFSTKAGKESYARVLTLLRQRGELITWSELTVDPILSEKVRKKLQAFKTKPILYEHIDRSTSILHKYRRLRSMLETSQFMVKELQNDKVDVDALSDRVAEMLLLSRSGGEDATKWFTHIGGEDDSSLRLIKKVLKPDNKKYIPTGFKAFDDRNRGFSRGSLVILASGSGGGKSLLAGQMAENMAIYGARVALISLEMDDEELGQRHLARITKTSMGRIIDPKKFSKDEKKQLILKHKEFQETIRRRDSLLSFITPQEDMTAEEILFALSPFGYDVLFIDYIGLLKGLDAEDQWRKMLGVTRFCKMYALTNKKLVVLCAQLTDEGLLASSRGMKRDCNNMWSWNMTPEAKESGIVPITQIKARQQEDFPFPLKFDMQHMIVSDLSETERQEIRVFDKKEDKKGKAGYNPKDKKDKSAEDYISIE